MNADRLIKTGFSCLTAHDVRRFLEFRKAGDAAHWALLRNYEDENGNLDIEDPELYAAQQTMTDAQKICSSWFDALIPDARFELLALSCFRRPKHDHKNGWRDAVREAEKDWHAHATGKRRLPATQDAADETLMAHLPDLEAMATALNILEKMKLIG